MAARDVRGFLRRSAAVVLAAVVVFALFALYETARRNGRQLDEALEQLKAERARSHDLLVTLDRQGGRLERQTQRLDAQTRQLATLRRALREAGLDPDEAIGRAPRGDADASSDGRGTPTPTDPPPAGSGDQGAGGGGSQNGTGDEGAGDDEGGAPPPPDEPPAEPPADDEPAPAPARCRVADPLTGGCLVRLDTPLDPLVDRVL